MPAPAEYSVKDQNYIPILPELLSQVTAKRALTAPLIKLKSALS
jgi:hypothetical protein